MPLEEWCFYCGNDRQYTYPDEATHQTDSGLIRVVTLKQVPLRTGIPIDRTPADETYSRKNAYGALERIILPSHDRRIAELDAGTFGLCLQIAASRIADLARDPNLKYVTFFVDGNGVVEDCGFIHTQLQVIGVTDVPKIRIAPQLQRSLGFYYGQQKERCLTCETIGTELKRIDRIVLTTDHFLSWIPYASRSPLEVCFTPLDHAASYEETPPSQFAELAGLILDVVRKLELLLGTRFPYQLKLFNAPVWSFGRFPNGSPEVKREHIQNAFHWRLVLDPNLEIPAVIREVVDYDINVLPPKVGAMLLRLPDHEISKWTS
ncbi:MAG: hypothetical protein PHF98_03960 [Patescibacteria group bacterium]|nr:hypothetical protein [Patescibacteria group bacterium]